MRRCADVCAFLPDKQTRTAQRIYANVVGAVETLMTSHHRE